MLRHLFELFLRLTIQGKGEIGIIVVRRLLDYLRGEAYGRLHFAAFKGVIKVIVYIRKYAR